MRLSNRPRGRVHQRAAAVPPGELARIGSSGERIARWANQQMSPADVVGVIHHLVANRVDAADLTAAGRRR